MSADLLLRLIGSLVPLALGIGSAFVLKNRKQGGNLPMWPIVIGALISIPGFALATLRPAAQQQTSKVEVMRVEQPLDGATEADLTPDYIREIASFIVDSLEKQMPGFRVTASTSIIEKNGKRLGIVRLNTGVVTPFISVIGVSRGKLVRITCGVTDQTNIDVRSPDCSRALKADFGTSLDG